MNEWIIIQNHGEIHVKSSNSYWNSVKNSLYAQFNGAKQQTGGTLEAFEQDFN